MLTLNFSSLFFPAIFFSSFLITANGLIIKLVTQVRNPDAIPFLSSHPHHLIYQKIQLILPLNIFGDCPKIHILAWSAHSLPAVKQQKIPNYNKMQLYWLAIRYHSHSNERLFSVQSVYVGRTIWVSESEFWSWNWIKGS